MTGRFSTELNVSLGQSVRSFPLEKVWGIMQPTLLRWGQGPALTGGATSAGGSPVTAAFATSRAWPRAPAFRLPQHKLVFSVQFRCRNSKAVLLPFTSGYAAQNQRPVWVSVVPSVQFWFGGRKVLGEQACSFVLSPRVSCVLRVLPQLSCRGISGYLHIWRHFRSRASWALRIGAQVVPSVSVAS